MTYKIEPSFRLQKQIIGRKVVGINQRGERVVLGFTVGERENQGAWESLLDDLKRR
jgi:transposase-like protein